jgi:glycosyltransferase involved in cell wall biosynthesis
MVDFSVLIPVYNTRPDHLLESVASIIHQTIPQKFNVIIVDDGSTDKGTLLMLQHLRIFAQIKVFTMPENKGAAAALNKGHELIDSEYIAVMGSDDVAHKDRLLRQTVYLLQNPKIDVLGTNIQCFYSDDIFRKAIFTSNHTRLPHKDRGWQTNHGTVMYRNQAVKDVGGYDENYRRSQDVELWNRMMKSGKIFTNMTDVLYLWRRYRK